MKLQNRGKANTNQAVALTEGLFPLAHKELGNSYSKEYRAFYQKVTEVRFSQNRQKIRKFFPFFLAKGPSERL